MEQNKKIFIVSGLILIILGIVVVVFYSMWRKGNTQEYVNNTNETATSSRALERLNSPVIQDLSNKLDELYKQDQDLDGLTDDEEKKYGTNPENIDSDGDGLTDKDEVLIYKSDPLSSDSDKDGFFDGYEVDRGYSPTGAGKLP